MQVVRLQALLEEIVAGDVLNLLQGVDLRQLVGDGKLVVRVDVSAYPAQGRLGLENERGTEAGRLELLVLFQRRHRVRAEPRSERRLPTVDGATVFRVPEQVQQVHCFAVGMPANDDVPYVVVHAPQLQGGRFARSVFVREML